MAFQSIKRILPGAIREAGLEEQVTSIQVLQTAETVLKRYWGEERAAFVSMRSYNEGVLRLETRTPAAAQEVKAMQNKFINEINRLLGAKKIVKVQCITL